MDRNWERLRLIHLASMEGRERVPMIHAAWTEGEKHVPVVHSVRMGGRRRLHSSLYRTNDELGVCT